MRRENYKSDLRVAVQLTLGGENIPVPDHDFMLRFTSVGSYMTRKYDCKRVGDVWTNCYERDGQIICCLDRHKFMPGQLNVEYYDYAPASDFPDGNYLKVVPRALDIELITGAGDDAEEIDATIAVDLTGVIADARLATTAANNAAANANAAAQNANNAAANANESADNADDAASRVQSVITTAEEVITESKTETTRAHSAAVEAEQAAATANDAAQNAERTAQGAREAANATTAVIERANTAITQARTATTNAHEAAERVEDVLADFNTDNYYTKPEINQKFSEIISGKSWIIVGELPLRGDSKYIYLVSNGSVGNNTYDEYVWLAFAGKYEKIGSTSVNLNDYYTKSQADSKFPTFSAVEGFAERKVLRVTIYDNQTASMNAVDITNALDGEVQCIAWDSRYECILVLRAIETKNNEHYAQFVGVAPEPKSATIQEVEAAHYIVANVYDDASVAYKFDKVLIDSSTLANALGVKQDVIVDLASIRRGAELGATALQSFTESDPTVPAWAKTPNKPSYSYGEITETPSLAAVATSGSYNDLSNKPTIPDVSGKQDKRKAVYVCDIEIFSSGELFTSEDLADELDNLYADWRNDILLVAAYDSITANIIERTISNVTLSNGGYEALVSSGFDLETQDKGGLNLIVSASPVLGADTYNLLGTTDSPVPTLPASYDNADEFECSFTCATDACVLTLPNGVKMADGFDFESDRKAGAKVQVSIQDGMAGYLMVSPTT